MIRLPDPIPGLVIRYAYLWRDKALRRREEGTKYRPAVVVLVATRMATTAPRCSSRPSRTAALPIQMPASRSPRKQGSGLVSTRIRRGSLSASSTASSGRDLTFGLSAPEPVNDIETPLFVI